MLILTRKENEEIIINSEIVIKIISASDNQIKLGIKAPEHIQILRGELYEEIKQASIDATEKSSLTPEKLSGIKINRLKGDSK